MRPGIPVHRRRTRSRRPHHPSGEGSRAATNPPGTARTARSPYPLLPRLESSLALQLVPASPVGSLKLTGHHIGSTPNGQRPPVMAPSVALGVAKVVLHLPESHSLKEKRQVVHGLLRRVRAEFQVSAAEVGGLGRWRLAELPALRRRDLELGPNSPE